MSRSRTQSSKWNEAFADASTETPDIYDSWYKEGTMYADNAIADAKSIIKQYIEKPGNMKPDNRDIAFHLMAFRYGFNSKMSESSSISGLFHDVFEQESRYKADTLRTNKKMKNSGIAFAAKYLSIQEARDKRQFLLGFKNKLDAIESQSFSFPASSSPVTSSSSVARVPPQRQTPVSEWQKELAIKAKEEEFITTDDGKRIRRTVHAYAVSVIEDIYNKNQEHVRFLVDDVVKKRDYVKFRELSDIDYSTIMGYDVGEDYWRALRHMINADEDYVDIYEEASDTDLPENVISEEELIRTNDNTDEELAINTYRKYFDADAITRLFYAGFKTMFNSYFLKWGNDRPVIITKDPSNIRIATNQIDPPKLANRLFVASLKGGNLEYSAGSQEFKEYEAGHKHITTSGIIFGISFFTKFDNHQTRRMENRPQDMSPYQVELNLTTFLHFFLGFYYCIDHESINSTQDYVERLLRADKISTPSTTSPLFVRDYTLDNVFDVELSGDVLDELIRTQDTEKTYNAIDIHAEEARRLRTEKRDSFTVHFDKVQRIFDAVNARMPAGYGSVWEYSALANVLFFSVTGPMDGASDENSAKIQSTYQLLAEYGTSKRPEAFAGLQVNAREINARDKALFKFDTSLPTHKERYAYIVEAAINNWMKYTNTKYVLRDSTKVLRDITAAYWTQNLLIPADHPLSNMLLAAYERRVKDLIRVLAIRYQVLSETRNPFDYLFFEKDYTLIAELIATVYNIHSELTNELIEQVNLVRRGAFLDTDVVVDDDGVDEEAEEDSAEDIVTKMLKRIYGGSSRNKKFPWLTIQMQNDIVGFLDNLEAEEYDTQNLEMYILSDDSVLTDIAAKSNATDAFADTELMARLLAKAYYFEMLRDYNILLSDIVKRKWKNLFTYGDIYAVKDEIKSSEYPELKEAYLEIVNTMPEMEEDKTANEPEKASDDGESSKSSTAFPTPLSTSQDNSPISPVDTQDPWATAETPSTAELVVDDTSSPGDDVLSPMERPPQRQRVSQPSEPEQPVPGVVLTNNETPFHRLFVQSQAIDETKELMTHYDEIEAGHNAGGKFATSLARFVSSNYQAEQHLSAYNMVRAYAFDQIVNIYNERVPASTIGDVYAEVDMKSELPKQHNADVVRRLLVISEPVAKALLEYKDGAVYFLTGFISQYQHIATKLANTFKNTAQPSSPSQNKRPTISAEYAVSEEAVLKIERAPSRDGIDISEIVGIIRSDNDTKTSLHLRGYAFTEEVICEIFTSVGQLPQYTSLTFDCVAMKTLNCVIETFPNLTSLVLDETHITPFQLRNDLMNSFFLDNLESFSLRCMRMGQSAEYVRVVAKFATNAKSLRSLSIRVDNEKNAEIASLVFSKITAAVRSNPTIEKVVLAPFYSLDTQTSRLLARLHQTIKEHSQTIDSVFGDVEEHALAMYQGKNTTDSPLLARRDVLTINITDDQTQDNFLGWCYNAINVYSDIGEMRIKFSNDQPIPSYFVRGIAELFSAYPSVVHTITFTASNTFKMALSQDYEKFISALGQEAAVRLQKLATLCFDFSEIVGDADYIVPFSVYLFGFAQTSIQTLRIRGNSRRSCSSFIRSLITAPKTLIPITRLIIENAVISSSTSFFSNLLGVFASLTTFSAETTRAAGILDLLTFANQAAGSSLEEIRLPRIETPINFDQAIVSLVSDTPMLRILTWSTANVSNGHVLYSQIAAALKRSSTIEQITFDAQNFPAETATIRQQLMQTPISSSYSEDIGKMLTSSKARRIIKDGKVRGHRLTRKQRRFFEWKAHEHDNE